MPDTSMFLLPSVLYSTAVRESDSSGQRCHSCRWIFVNTNALSPSCGCHLLFKKLFNRSLTKLVQVCQKSVEEEEEEIKKRMFTWLKWFFVMTKESYRDAVHSMADETLVLDLQQAWKEELNNFKWLLGLLYIGFPQHQELGALGLAERSKKIWCLNLFWSTFLQYSSHTSCQELINSFCSKDTVNSVVA